MTAKRKAAPSGNGNPNSVGVRTENKDRHFANQMQRVFLSFSERPKTMLEVSQETGILRANICRYVGKMRNRGQIAVVCYGLCPITKFRVGFYTTDTSLFPTYPTQQNLFGGQSNE